MISRSSQPRSDAPIFILGFIGFQLSKIIHRLFIAPLSSQLRDLPGPKSKSLIWGNFKEINKAGPGELHAEWVREYGPTMSYKVSLLLVDCKIQVVYVI